MGPHPAVAQVRLAVRRCLSGAGLAPGDLVLAACSGGADSLALASALAFEAPRLGLRGGGVTVDHGLQDGSDEQARRAAKALKGMGLQPVDSVTVAVAARAPPATPVPRRRRGRPGTRPCTGPPARAAPRRYCSATPWTTRPRPCSWAWRVAPAPARWPGCPSAPAPSCARCCGSAGPRPGPPAPRRTSSHGMTRRTPTPGFARARVRHRLLPALEAELGPGVAEALARSARLLRADADFLDALAKSELERIAPPGSGHSLPLDALAALPEAIRSRVLRNAAMAAGCPPGALSARHVAGLEALVTGWRGQRWTDLPGGVRAWRRYGKLQFGSGDDVEGAGGRE